LIGFSIHLKTKFLTFQNKWICFMSQIRIRQIYICLVKKDSNLLINLLYTSARHLTSSWVRAPRLLKTCLSSFLNLNKKFLTCWTTFINGLSVYTSLLHSFAYSAHQSIIYSSSKMNSGESSWHNWIMEVSLFLFSAAPTL